MIRVSKDMIPKISCQRNQCPEKNYTFFLKKTCFFNYSNEYANKSIKTAITSCLQAFLCSSYIYLMLQKISAIVPILQKKAKFEPLSAQLIMVNQIGNITRLLCINVLVISCLVISHCIPLL